MKHWLAALALACVITSACLAAGIGRSGANFTTTTSNSGNAFTAGDWSAPVVSVSAPAANARMAGRTPTFTGAAGTLSGDLSTVTVRIYSGTDTGGALVGSGTAAANSSGAWSLPSPLSLADGTYTVQASQSDATGNAGRSAAVTFTVDGTPPAPTVTAPIGYVGLGLPALAGTAGNATGDNNAVTVTIKQGPTVVDTSTVTRSGTSWTATPTSPLAQGTYTITATQADDLGNAATSAARTFTVDTTAPAVTLTTPSAGASFKNRLPTISGAAGTAAGDLTAITVKLYSGAGTGGAVLQTLTPTAAGGVWSATPTSLADGTYTAQATQADQAGNVATSSAIIFTVDNVAPAPAVTAPSGYVATATPTLSGTAGNAPNDDATVTVEVLSGASVVRTLTPARTGTTWSVAVPPGSPLSDGSYAVRVTQGDVAGNTATSAPRAFTVDTVAPAVTVNQPVSGGATKATTPTLSGAAGNAAGDATTVAVKLYAGTGTGGTLLQNTTVTRSGATWSTTASALTNGTYTVQATQADGAGNSRSTTSTFTVDTVAPAPVVTAPTGYVLSGATTVTGTAGTATGDSSTVTVEVLSGATVVATNSGVAVGGAGGWSTPVSGLADGAYTARVTQTDWAGNATLSSSVSFTVDMTTPAPAITGPSTSYVATGAPAIVGTAGTASGDAATVTIKLYSGVTATGTPIQTLSATRTGAAWSTAPSPSLGDGTYTATVTQGDAAGHSGTSTAVTFTVDTVAPSPTVTAPTGYTGQTPTISGTAGSATGDATTVTVEILSGASVVQTAGVTRTGTTWSTTATTLPQGAYTVRVRQTDAAGNAGLSSSIAFTVDTVAPTVSVTAPAAGSFTTNATPTLSGTAGTATGDLPTITARIYNSGGTLVQTRTATAVAGAWSTTATTLAEGTYTVQASQSDAAGNIGTSTTNTITIDTTAPTAANVTTTNAAGGTAGAFDAGDTIAFTYSEAMAPGSIVTGWNGTGSQAVTLTFTNGATDTLAITNAGATVHLASAINLSATFLKKNWPTTGTLTRTSPTTYTVTLDATPANSFAAKNPAAGANIAWTPETAANDLAGNSAAATTFTQTGAGIGF